MTARPISELVAPIVARAMGLARVQHFLDAFDPDKREEWIADFEQGHTVDEDEAVLLREHNADDEPWYG